MGIARLKDRGVVRVSGADAESFLQNLLTCDMAAISPEQAGFGALLTPQGKILFDFIVYRDGDGAFLFDLAASRVEAFVKRLGFYRLRAKVNVEDISGDHAVAVGWDGAPMPDHAVAAAPDPRLAVLGWRAILRPDDAPANGEQDYHAHRIALSVPEGGKDFSFEEAFPHEADMDQLHGISFSKGCYVGQEVVSRMQHRSTARTRVVGATVAGAELPAPGTPIMASDKTIGTVGSSAAGKLVVTVRIDKVLDAMAAGAPMTAGGIPLALRKPEWAGFDFPVEV